MMRCRSCDGSLTDVYVRGRAYMRCFFCRVNYSVGWYR